MKVNGTPEMHAAKSATTDDTRRHTADVERFKRRMLEWDNPVEYVNNMYGSHPDDDDNEYFEVVFGD